VLTGTHRQSRATAHGWAIYWRLGRGAGAQKLAVFRGRTLEEAEAAEAAGAEELAEAWLALRRPPPLTGRLDGMVHAYRQSPGFAGLAPRTRQMWARSLDVIAREIGDLTARQLDGRHGPDLLIAWRDRRAATPRTADYHAQVLTSVLRHARRRRWIDTDPMTDWERLYRPAGRAEIVWTAAEIEALAKAASPDMARAIRFLHLTGMRRGDAVAARWDQIDEAAGLLVVKTGKTRQRHAAPIGPDLAALLAATPRRAVQILTGPSGRPYRPDSLTQGLLRALARVRAGDPARGRPPQPGFAAGKRLHDLRGTSATNEVVRLLADPAVRERFGWTATAKTGAPAAYVDSVATLAAARKIARENAS
jgi:integrase